MRRIATWLLVAAVVALGVVAAFDALQSEEVVAREPPPPTRTATTATVQGLTGQAGPAAARLRDAHVAGVLTYADDDCRLSAVSLPDLEPVRAPLSEFATRIYAEGERWGAVLRAARILPPAARNNNT